MLNSTKETSAIQLRWEDDPLRPASLFVKGGNLIRPHPIRRLAGKQEGFDEFALAANCKAGKFLNHFPAETSGSVSSQCAKEATGSLLRRRFDGFADRLLELIDAFVERGGDWQHGGFA